MSPTWDDGLDPKERANLVRRLHRVWGSAIPMDEVVGEMAGCLRCDGAPQEVACGLCDGRGVLGWFTEDIVIAMALDAGLPRDRPQVYCPNEAEIASAAAKIRLGWTRAQVEASLRGIMPSGGANERAGRENRETPRSPDALEGRRGNH